MLVSAFVVLAVAVINYYVNFDILAPGIGNLSGSVKSNMGALFIAPVLVLTFGQVIYTAGVLHLVVRSFYFERRDFLKAFFAASVEVLFYSVFYTFYPSWGPYLYIVGPFRDTPIGSYLILLAWTAFAILAMAYLVKRLYAFKKGEIRVSMLILISAAMLTLVLAMAD